MKSNFTIAIPMAGYGSRMRPHTWSKPKPLIHLAGKTVLDYVLAQFDSLPGIENADWVFIVGPYQTEQVSAHMQQYHPEKKVNYVVQEVMRGQSDALYMAREHFDGPVLMAFSDTLIETDLSFLPTETADGIAWVKPVPDPRRFGVAELNGGGSIHRLIEKPKDLKNNLALVGFYYFRNGADLISAIEEQFRRDVSLKGEYFLADAINILLERNSQFRTQSIDIWMDAGLPEALLETNRYLLEHGHDNSVEAAQREGVTIIPPVFIPADATITASVIGPHVSMGPGCEMDHVVVHNSVIEGGTQICSRVLESSLIGRHARVLGKPDHLNISDNSFIEE